MPRVSITQTLDTYGYLAHITTAEEQALIEDLLQGAFGYIGAYKYSEGTTEWFWIDGPSSELPPV